MQIISVCDLMYRILSSGLFRDVIFFFFPFQSSELQHDRAGAESRLQRRGDCQAVSVSFSNDSDCTQ
jgi:hypothetical protein